MIEGARRARLSKPTLLKLPLDKRRWLEEWSEQTGESMTAVLLDALAAEMKKQARIERRAQRQAQ